MRTPRVIRNDCFDGCRDGFCFISQFRPRFIWIFIENLKKIGGSTYARKNVSDGDGKFQRKTPKISTRTYSTSNVMRIVGTNGIESRDVI